jgi:hypothetical protein
MRTEHPTPAVNVRGNYHPPESETHMKTRIRSLLHLLSAALVAGLFAPLTRGQNIVGKPVVAGAGTIRSYVQFEGGVPVRVGILIDAAGFASFGPMAANPRLSLPIGVAPYDHIDIGWNPMGHAGPGYAVPHFDIHFYFITPEEQEAIPFGVAPFMPVPADEVASNYLGDPNRIPMMGVHYGDQLAPQVTGGPFTATFIYGYNDGQMNFVEPMINRATLLAGGSVLLPVRTPARVRRTGYYPTTYGFNVTGTGDARVYDIFVSGLEPRISAVPLVPGSGFTNLAVRGRAGTGDETLIAGFVIGGGAKQMLIRAVGPRLQPLGVTGVLADPALIVYDSTGQIVAQNDNWSAGSASTTSTLINATTKVGALPLPANSLDAAFLTLLAPGSYTAHARGIGSTTGVVMIEAYEVP